MVADGPAAVRPAGRRAALVVAVVAAACLTAATASALLVSTHPDRSVVRAVPVGGHRLSEQRVVVLGDSVATGAGCGCSPFGPRLATLLATRLHRPVQVSTLAKDGLTSSDLLAQLRSDPTTIRQLGRASAVTVTISANDFDEGAADESCPAGTSSTACYDDDLRALQPRMSEVLRTLRKLTPPRARILVTGYWNVFLDGLVGANKGKTYARVSDALTHRVNDLLQAATQRAGATYVDLYRAFRGDDGTTDDTNLLAADGDHPNDAGQQRIAQVLVGTLTTDDPS